MTPRFNLTEATIRRHASGDSFQRGQRQYPDEAVRSLVRRGDVLEALVEGSAPEPCRVRCTFDPAGITEAVCSCHSSSGGWCEHVVAALLATVQGKEIEERPSLQTLLAALEREQLQSVLLRLGERNPDVAEAIEAEINLLQWTPAAAAAPSAGKPEQRRTPVDLNAVRRQINAALRSPPYASSRSGWHFFSLGSEAHQLLEQAWGFIRAGEGHAALEILNAMTDECLENWQAIMEDEEGETLTFVTDELGPAWIEAILSADLTPGERDGWFSKLDAWSGELADYGDATTFDAALLALQEGWDDPTLQRILRGEMGEPEPEEGIAHHEWSTRNWLTAARLNVLERQGQYGEYLNLARAEGEVARYAVMLVREGRAAEAVDYGLAHLQQTEDALQLAQALREAGELERALRIAERGLALEGKKAALGTWLADLAAGMGEQELAVRAATVAFEEEKSLVSYLRVQELAGEEWPQRREELLNHLRKTRDYYPQGPVDIFLHEGLMGDAIALLDQNAYVSHRLVEQVADAAIETHPEWVIRASRKQAEDIMDRGKADLYDAAARWLAKAKQAYATAGREEEWNRYRAELLEQHHRKYKLVPLLKALR